MSARHVIKSYPSIASTQSGYTHGRSIGTMRRYYVCSVRQSGRPAGGRKKQTETNTGAASAVKCCHDSHTAVKDSPKQMHAYAKSAIERSLCSGKVWSKRGSTAQVLAEDSSSPRTNLQSKCSWTKEGKGGSAKNVSSPDVSTVSCVATDQCLSEQMRKRRWRRLRGTSATGSANGACTLRVPGAALNEHEARKERIFNSSCGFAGSVSARQQRRRSSSTRLAAVAVSRKDSHCRSLCTNTGHGAAALAGARQTGRMPVCRNVATVSPRHAVTALIAFAVCFHV